MAPSRERVVRMISESSPLKYWPGTNETLNLSIESPGLVTLAGAIRKAS